jgi:hypothetical protein
MAAPKKDAVEGENGAAAKPRLVISVTGDQERVDELRNNLRRLQAKMVLEDPSKDVTQLDALLYAVGEACAV